MTLRQIRQERGLSQEQLAQMAGISLRTLQRAEQGATPSAETLKCLASALDLKFEDLRKEPEVMTEVVADQKAFSEEEIEAARKYVEGLKGFYLHIAIMVVSLVIIYVVNLLVSPWYMWAHWAALGMASSIGIHAIVLFGHLVPSWEKRQIEKRLNRNR